MFQLTVGSIIWLCLGIVFAVLEGVTVQLVALWFAVGAAIAALAASLGAAVLAQILIFCVVSGLLLAGTRPFLKRKFTVQKEKTNADALVGKIGVVKEGIDPLGAPGRVFLEGQDWAAVTEGAAQIPPGEKVMVLRIEGVKLVVRLSVKSTEENG